MRTCDPKTLIEVAIMSGNGEKTRVVNQDLADCKERVRMWKPDGTPQKVRYPGEFEWMPGILATGNILEIGTPKLEPGWKQRIAISRLDYWQHILKIDTKNL